MYQEEQARSQDPLRRFFDIAGGRNPQEQAVKLLGGLDTMRRQAILDQQTAEKHQLDRAIQTDTLLKNERDTWNWVQQQYDLLETPEQQEQFVKMWSPRLAERHNRLTGSDTMTAEDAAGMLSRPGSVDGLITGMADVDDQTRRNYLLVRRAKGAAEAEKYLDDARKRMITAAGERIPGILDPIIDAMTQENSGRAPLIPAVVKRVTDAIDTMEAQEPGSVRRRFGVSPQMAKDAVSGYGNTEQGKRYYEGRGLKTSKVVPSLTDLKIGEDLATAIIEDPEFQKRGIPITDLGTLSAEEQTRLRVRGQNRLESRKAAEKAEGRSQAAADKAQADRDKPVLDPGSYVDRDHMRESGGEVRPPQFEITKGDVQSGRYIKVTAKQREAVASADQAHEQATTIFNNADKLITAETVYGAGAQKIALETGAFTGAIPDAAALKGQIKALSQIARALGEKGVLTDTDIERILALMPAFGDTVHVLGAKREYLVKILQTSKDTARAQMLGEDVSVYRKRLRVLGEEAERAVARPANAPKRLNYGGADSGRR
jgi:hypothetical protein